MSTFTFFKILYFTFFAYTVHFSMQKVVLFKCAVGLLLLQAYTNTNRLLHDLILLHSKFCPGFSFLCIFGGIKGTSIQPQVCSYYQRHISFIQQLLVNAILYIYITVLNLRFKC